MHPVLLDLWGFEIHTYGALGAVAFLLGCSLVLWRAWREGIDINRLADVIFGMAVAALLGTRLVYVLQHPEVVQSVWDFFNLRNGGLVFYGAFILGIPTGFALMYRAGLPTFTVFDIFATGAPLAHGISRVGCFFAGCCWGTPHDGALAVTFPAESALAPGGIPLHPVQLYEALALFGVAIATNVFFAHRKFAGQVFLLYLLLYAGVRSVTEMFRGDLARGFFFPELFGEALSFSQGMSLVFVVVGIAVFFIGARQGAPSDRAPSAT